MIEISQSDHVPTNCTVSIFSESSIRLFPRIIQAQMLSPLLYLYPCGNACSGHAGVSYCLPIRTPFQKPSATCMSGASEDDLPGDLTTAAATTT